MTTLKDILYKVNLTEVSGSTAVDILELTFDSRKVKAGTLFVALRGTQADGHDFIEKAVAAGAAAILCEQFPAEKNDQVTYVKVPDSAVAMGIIADNFFGNPSAQLKVVGVTGTNGKTTTATLLFRLFRTLGHTCGLLSTVQNQVEDTIIPSTHTTPDSITLNQLLRQMVEEGCEYVFMEVSSHAVVQHRIAGIRFTGAIFSNITHDHLDYHKTFEEYIRAKKKFFDDLPAEAFALTNLDDKRGMVMLQNTRARKHTYSLTAMSDFKGRVIENGFNGLVMNIDGEEFHSSLIGDFNAYNLMAIYGAARLLGKEKVEVLAALSSIRAAEGRFDYVTSKRDKIVGIIDYAHTPDALQKVLATIKNIRSGNEQVITVVGCGGDRDKTKRPVMAKVACDFSDRLIITSDNPRTEDPEEIIRDMSAGVDILCAKKTLFITDRRQAIKTACTLAGKGDIVLLAGKGHEKYQEINGIKHPFDDKEILIETLQTLER